MVDAAARTFAPRSSRHCLSPHTTNDSNSRFAVAAGATAKVRSTARVSERHIASPRYADQSPASTRRNTAASGLEAEAAGATAARPLGHWPALPDLSLNGSSAVERKRSSSEGV